MNARSLVSQARKILEDAKVPVNLETLPIAVAQLAIERLSCPGFERAKPDKPGMPGKRRPEPIE